MAKELKEQSSTPSQSNVIDLFSRKPLAHNAPKAIRLAPELDQLEMLYTNDSTPNKLFSMKIACWSLRDDGTVVAMVPWLDGIVPCTEIDDPLNGRWEGYRNPHTNEIFYEAPNHKVSELKSAAEFYSANDEKSPEVAVKRPYRDEVIQEIPDVIGTHAVLTQNGFRSFTLIEVLSWQLRRDGTVHGMLVDEMSVDSTPVLPGDPCLFSAQTHPEFRYFFQHRIANKIKEQDPDALAAISLLIEH
jgi:hypothetical protein